MRGNDTKSKFIGLRLSDNDMVAAAGLSASLGFRNIQDMLRWLLSVGFRAFHGGVLADNADVALLFVRAYKSDRQSAIELCRRSKLFALRLPEPDKPNEGMEAEIKDMFAKCETAGNRAFRDDINKRL